MINKVFSIISFYFILSPKYTFEQGDKAISGSNSIRISGEIACPHTYGIFQNTWPMLKNSKFSVHFTVVNKKSLSGNNNIMFNQLPSFKLTIIKPLIGICWMGTLLSQMYGFFLMKINKYIKSF